MKKLSALMVASVLSAAAFAQCSPSPLADLTVVNPLPTNPLPDATVGVSYNQTISFAASGQQIDPTLVATLFGINVPSIPGMSITVAVTRVEVVSVSGVPAGLTATANTTPSEWNTGEAGCFSLSGTPTTPGDFQITFSMNADVEYTLNGGAPNTLSTPQPVPVNYDVKSLANNASINEFNTAGLNLFPNPAGDVFTIAYPATQTDMATIEITDMSGKTVSSVSKSINTYGGNLSVDISGLTNGLYRVSFTSGSVRTATKLVVQK